MSYNRPYIFELAHQLLADRHAGNSVEGHYANAERNGISRAVLDRAANTLQRIAPEDFVTWIRQEYLVDGWLHGYVDVAAGSADELTTWVLGQLAEAHYSDDQAAPTPNP
ncbi:hypothetical protein [Mycolicibacterium llatzerense]|uniref:hypothetical protein n=1 Tax=Mycolicibacterium llatzerense TaxID=280871 RepID=UPI0021B6141E|nr:hypothetical protein [Mycolicibacterium llatzerense]MCT7367289.1 hypothetical protein [Mycolicibacterium llatzerense]